MYDMIRIKDIAVGACDMPNRTKPGICIQTEKGITCYGFFRNEDEAHEFMKYTADAIRKVHPVTEEHWD